MKTIRYAFVRSLPIMAGYIVLGLGFGVLLQSKGLRRGVGAGHERADLRGQYAVCRN